MDRERVGTMLLVLGVLAWPLGFVLKATVFPGIRSVPDILVPHLLGVVPGVFLRGSRFLKLLRR
ncbi:hypothetical protein BMS3Abin16_00154 [archaeon BMS3Abin16]|nr:hypothetical protein BMS3Abin16_00154 [archaeon BMS3Abin16]GBE56041.1 hypothetical protein BMS3Bbin16_00238 [archaeon BMS3Bbin16]HDY74674.1 hypothetical protein [Euryarchaeota archaeon]